MTKTEQLIVEAGTKVDFLIGRLDKFEKKLDEFEKERMSEKDIELAIGKHFDNCPNQKGKRTSVAPNKKEFWTASRIETAKIIGITPA